MARRAAGFKGPSASPQQVRPWKGLRWEQTPGKTQRMRPGSLFQLLIPLSRICQDYPSDASRHKGPFVRAGENSGCQTRAFSELVLLSLDSQPPHLDLSMPNKGWHHSAPIMLCSPRTVSSTHPWRAFTGKCSQKTKIYLVFPGTAQHVFLWEPSAFVEWINELLLIEHLCNSRTKLSL